MNCGEMIKRIAEEEGIKISSVAKELGLTRQAMYKRINCDMRWSHFVETVEAMGYEVEVKKRGMKA